MRKTRRRSSRRNFNLNPNTVWGVLGIVGALGVLGFVLSGVVISDNKSACGAADGNTYEANLMGCVADEKYAYDNILIIAGNTANTPKPELTKLSRRYLVNSLLKDAEANIKIYSAAKGSSRISFKFDKNGADFAEVYDKEQNSKEKMKLINEYIDTIEEATHVAPKLDGADYLEAIERAASHSDEDEKNLVIVLGSGLSDNGKLNFAKDGILTRRCGEDYCSAEDLAATFAERDDRENLIGHDIIWAGIGSTIEPQHALDNDSIEKIKDLYRAVLEAKGAEVINLDDEFDASDESVETDKHVDPTDQPMRDSFWAKKQIFDENSELGFQGSSTVFLNEDKAREVLKSLADATNSGQRFKVVTSVAVSSCTTPRRISLAEDRVGRIKSMVAELGGKVESIETYALPTGFVDECPDGRRSEDLAKQNRTVHIEPLN